MRSRSILMKTLCKMQKPIKNSLDFTKNVFGMSFRSPSYGSYQISITAVL